MTDASSPRGKPLYVLLGAVALAAVVWGAYAWRFMSSGERVPSVAGADSPASSELGGEGGLTDLRATAGGTSGDVLAITQQSAAGSSHTGGQATMSGAIRTNAPPSSDNPIQITLAQRPVAPRADVQALLADGRSALAEGRYVEARRALSAALETGLPSAEEQAIRQELARLAEALIFSRATNTDDPLTASHEVATRESLNLIARQNKVTQELLGRINGIRDPSKLHVGRRLKVVRGPFRAVIDKSDHRLDVYLGEAYVKGFIVGLGAKNGTPAGVWLVNNKLSNPDWTDPSTGRHYLADDPENPIGERWIGLYGLEGEAVGKSGFGIHGTIDAGSIGRDLSMGCVRLADRDVREVYDLLALNESQVVVRP